ncbi:hypothetical protein SNR37_000344 [Agarivorans aestuarii]|uniref:Peptidoglycan binding-like domain-containing protein n=1 Tax=Agarivorans aestuarii TaxID=1563703 RepID=A0ABU7G6I2_9ALTE|nr:hypothetical protein [Agarivorans aestuarii]MEE1675022.1 hypothetical protein [Agarivorans aestuarii]
MAKLQITQSVGVGGVNKPNDIKAVQAALNKLLGLIPPIKKLAEDGKLGSKPENSKTVAAIKAFQKKVVGMVHPDGKIDANGRSHRKFNEKLSAVTIVAVTPLSGTLKTKLKAKLEQYEGRVPHMYLDTVGKVTVGVGHMMPDVKAAQKVPFTVSATGLPATAKQIEDDFNTIKNKWSSVDANNIPVARYYKQFTLLELSDSEIDKSINKHIASFEKELNSFYGSNSFSAYSDNVKLALFDMIFNLGLTKLKSKFPKFNAHIKAGDFKKAAIESNRPQLSPDRNTYVRNLLSNIK